jgi:hypothetical protein
MIMALAYYDAADVLSAPLYRADTALSADESVHVRTYCKFVAFARFAACGVPFFMAFLLYWTT